jgi:DNA-binding response OmpR family regulator
MGATVSDRYRIAIVETDDQMRQLSERWLQEAGHRVDALTMEQLQQGDGFDLLIVDAADPHAALPLIRQAQAVHDAPVLLTSARFRRGQGVSTQLALQLGVQAVLPKPFARAELLRAIAVAMR